MTEIKTEHLKQKQVGRMMLSTDARHAKVAAERNSKARGRIQPTDVTAKKDEKEDKPEAIPVAQADVITGVIAATVMTNRIMPASINQSTWDIAACFYAVIGSGFTEFRLPATGVPIQDYAIGLEDAEFDEASFVLMPPKQNLMNIRTNRDYVIQGQARCNQEGLAALMAVSQPGVTMHPLRWAGPWSEEEQHLMSITITPHVGPGGALMTHTPATVTVDVPPADLVESGYDALIDLTLETINGSDWHVYPTRIR